MKTLFRYIKNNDGSIINIALSMLLLMSSMGISATTTTTDDVKIATNYKYDRQAFFNAFSGVQYGLTQMENGLAHETFTLPAQGANKTLSYTPPSGFSFGLTSIAADATYSNLYSFSATGTGPKNASAKIETVFERRISPFVTYAAFGDVSVDLKNGGHVYSYDSRTDDPDPNDSTGEGDVGSNQHVELKMGGSIDGDVILGEDTSGTPGTLTDHGTTTTGTEGDQIERVPPDPLGVGVVGGEYESKFSATGKDNNMAVPTTAIDASYAIDFSGGGGNITLNGKSGGANYYLTSIDLSSHGNLIIDATNGPVNIFLTGGLNAGVGSTIDVQKNGVPGSGSPTDFSIFSNSSANIVFKHGTEFVGLVYAPYASVEMKNDADFFGAIWGRTVDIKNSGEVFYDAALGEKYPAYNSHLDNLSWRQLY